MKTSTRSSTNCGDKLMASALPNPRQGPDPQAQISPVLVRAKETRFPATTLAMSKPGKKHLNYNIVG